MSPKKISAVIARLRKREGWSQAELARRAKVSQSYLNQLESGAKGKRPGVKILQRLGKALGVPVTELLG
ncbi:MAG: helix-turn-helix transcriptional regulator [Candidatus Rokubacteria bacterium]|nr:helix-turn-helix transcriptional regulator [Candidatus Rokubacteria bacterium]